MRSSPVAQWVKNPPALQETQVGSLDQGDPLDLTRGHDYPL